MEHAYLDPDTGFGRANAPTSTYPDVARVREAESLLQESLALHDRAVSTYHQQQLATEVSLSSGVECAQRVQPKAKVMLRYALVQAALGKREQAVETLHQIAQMDPWLPELELRPPNVAQAHRISVEQAKSGLVWYYNSNHDALKANRYRDDVIMWKMRRVNQEFNSEWAPGDLLTQGLEGITAPPTGAHTSCLVRAPEPLTDPQLSHRNFSRGPSQSAPLLPLPDRQKAWHVPEPNRDPQAGKSSTEQHMLKLLCDAENADDKDLTISILARAIEHAAASTAATSPPLLEALIEHSYHIVSAANPSTATSTATAIHLLLHALQALKVPTPKSPSGSQPCAQLRLDLRRRAVHALSVALHQHNRVTEPLQLQRRALALTLRSCRNAEAVVTLESRVHIVSLCAARLFMLSPEGAEELSRSADGTDCLEGRWKTTYGRGRPGRSSRYFHPVIPRDNTEEIHRVWGWLQHNLRMSVRILALHMLKLAHAAVEQLQDIPEPFFSTTCLPTRHPSPPLTRLSSNSNLPQISEDSHLDAHHNSSHSDSEEHTGTADDSSLEVAMRASTFDDIVGLDSDPPAPGMRGIFRVVSQRSRRVHIVRNVDCSAQLAAVQHDSRHWSVGELVRLLQHTCEEADAVAKEAQAKLGFAVAPPPWVSQMCLSHWKIVHRLLGSGLPLGEAPPGTPSVPDLVEHLGCILSVYSDYFTEPPQNDGDSDMLGIMDPPSAPPVARTRLPSPLSCAPMRPSAPASSDPEPRPNVYIPPDTLQLPQSATPTQPPQQPAAPAGPPPNQSAHAPISLLLPPDSSAAPPPAPPSPSLSRCGSKDMACNRSPYPDTVCATCLDPSTLSPFYLERPSQRNAADPMCHLRSLFDSLQHSAAAVPDPLTSSDRATYPADAVNEALVMEAPNRPGTPPALWVAVGSPVSSMHSPPTPSSHLRLFCRSDSLPSALPSPTVVIANRLLTPKPTIESFGLEQDEQTPISLGPTPIPCMLAMCFSSNSNEGGPPSPQATSQATLEEVNDSNLSSPNPPEFSSPKPPEATLSPHPQPSTELPPPSLPSTSHPEPAGSASLSLSSLPSPPAAQQSRSKWLALVPKPRSRAKAAQAAARKSEQRKPEPRKSELRKPDPSLNLSLDLSTTNFARRIRASTSLPTPTPFTPVPNIFGSGGTLMCTSSLSDTAARSTPSSSPIAATSEDSQTTASSFTCPSREGTEDTMSSTSTACEPSDCDWEAPRGGAPSCDHLPVSPHLPIPPTSNAHFLSSDAFGNTTVDAAHPFLSSHTPSQPANLAKPRRSAASAAFAPPPPSRSTRSTSASSIRPQDAPSGYSSFSRLGLDSWVRRSSDRGLPADTRASPRFASEPALIPCPASATSKRGSQEECGAPLGSRACSWGKPPSSPTLQDGGETLQGCLWGRRGPQSDGVHMRARSVCLDHLEL